MKIAPRIKPFDVYDCQNVTDRHKHYLQSQIEKTEAAKEDTEKEKRLKSQLCKWCFYLASGLGGASITIKECEICSEEQMFGSTNTNTLCMACATKSKLCKHCGSDMEYKKRKKL